MSKEKLTGQKHWPFFCFPTQFQVILGDLDTFQQRSTISHNDFYWQMQKWPVFIFFGWAEGGRACGKSGNILLYLALSYWKADIISVLIIKSSYLWVESKAWIPVVSLQWNTGGQRGESESQTVNSYVTGRHKYVDFKKTEILLGFGSCNILLWVLTMSNILCPNVFLALMAKQCFFFITYTCCKTSLDFEVS